VLKKIIFLFKLLISLIFLVLLIVVGITLFSDERNLPKNADLSFKPKFGISFSQNVAKEYGYEWKNFYTRILDDLKPDWVRVNFFWNQMIDDQGNLDLSDLIFQIEEAQKRDVKVIVALGLKVPYYPEFYLPSNLKEKLSYGQEVDKNEEIAQAIMATDRQIIKSLSKYDNISFWQVENEPSISDVGFSVSTEFVKKEAQLVKAEDPKKRPILVSFQTEFGFRSFYTPLLLILEKDDAISFNMFLKTQTITLPPISFFGKEIRLPWPRVFNFPFFQTGPASPKFSRLKSKIESLGHQFMVLEMQAEPYNKNMTKFSDNAFIYPFKPADIKRSTNFLRFLKVEYVGFWGIEWVYKAVDSGNSSWLSTIKEEIGK